MILETIAQYVTMIITQLDHPPPWLLWTLYVTSGFTMLKVTLRMVPVTSRALWKLTKFGWRTEAIATKKTAAFLRWLSDRLDKK